MRTILIDASERGSFVVDKTTSIARLLEMRRAFFECVKWRREWSFSVASNVRRDVIQYAIDHSKKRMDSFMEMFCSEIAAEASNGHLSKEQMLALYQLGCRRGHGDILLSLALRIDLPDELIGKFLNTRDDEVKRHFLLRNYRLKRNDVNMEFVRYFAVNFETLSLNQLVPLLCDTDSKVKQSVFEVYFRLLPTFAPKIAKELKTLQRQGLSRLISLIDCRSYGVSARAGVKAAVRQCNRYLLMPRPVRIYVKDVLSSDSYRVRACRNPLFMILDVVFKAQGVCFPESKIRAFCKKLSEQIE